MLAIGTRVKVKGVYWNEYGEITKTDKTIYPYRVRLDSGHCGWFPESSVRAVEKEDT